MDYLKVIKEILHSVSKQPFLVVFLVSMGVVWFALYVVLQAITKR